MGDIGTMITLKQKDYDTMTILNSNGEWYCNRSYTEGTMVPWPPLNRRDKKKEGEVARSASSRVEKGENKRLEFPQVLFAFHKRLSTLYIYSVEN
jgi:hypothetical protein